jgi:dTDP-4-dehydrorhamnose reductase
VRILVTGAAGMLGHALVPVLEEQHQVIPLTRKDGDLSDEVAARAAFQTQQADLVIHLAAFTDVDGCELDPQKAKAWNEIATLNVAKASKRLGAAMLYISTDYVFDGRSKRPYREDDPPNPLNVYGRTKLRGEEHVQQTLDHSFIVRTSWLFGPHGKNFVSTILRLAREKSELRIVNDQQGSPTYTRHLAQRLAELVMTREYGIHHLTGGGSCTWYEFARKIVDRAGIERVQVTPVTSREYKRAAARPAYSVLANGRAGPSGAGLLPNWEQGLASYLEEIREGQDAAGREADGPVKKAFEPA